MLLKGLAPALALAPVLAFTATPAATLAPAPAVTLALIPALAFALAPETTTQGLHSSSFWGFPYRILNMNPKKEPLWSLRVNANQVSKREDVSRVFSKSVLASISGV